MSCWEGDPLLADSVGLFGTASSAFCYHPTMPFLEELYRGGTPMAVSVEQGFARLKELI